MIEINSSFEANQKNRNRLGVFVSINGVVFLIIWNACFLKTRGIHLALSPY